MSFRRGGVFRNSRESLRVPGVGVVSQWSWLEAKQGEGDLALRRKGCFVQGACLLMFLPLPCTCLVVPGSCSCVFIALAMCLRHPPWVFHHLFVSPARGPAPSSSTSGAEASSRFSRSPSLSVIESGVWHHRFHRLIVYNY